MQRVYTHMKEVQVMKTIAIANRKGGVGKSTTAAALIAGLTLRGYRVLGVDLDAQRNLSSTTKGRGDKTILGALTGEITAKEAIKTTETGDIIPASKALSGADMVITETGKEYKLKEALEPLQSHYDYCILDCPPALGILTINALVAANGVIIPAGADLYSLEGIEDLYESILPVRKYCNPQLAIIGILLTRYNARSVLSKDATELARKMADKLGTTLFNTTIREGVAVKEAQIKQDNLFTYAPKANVTKDYSAFIDEFLNMEGWKA